jgi:dolichol-phosphate mannosyltransferase
LQAGLEHVADTSGWILTLDADVRPVPLLVRSLLAHANSNGIRALSIATRQTLSGAAEGLIHPSMLATLVYRYGIPGHATRRIEQVQANGQCFLVRRDVLSEVGGFSSGLHSVCEDVTLARSIAASGHEVGFYESDRLVAVEMYAGARDAWDNWTRSLPMRDRFAPGWINPGMVEVLLVQALPQWIVACFALRSAFRHPLTRLNVGLLCVRIGVLAGMARAYEQRPWTYWVSPVLDLPVALRIVMMARKTRHTWRGRTIVPGESG